MVWRRKLALQKGSVKCKSDEVPHPDRVIVLCDLSAEFMTGILKFKTDTSLYAQ